MYDVCRSHERMLAQIEAIQWQRKMRIRQIGAIGISVDVPNYGVCLCLDGIHVVGRRDSFNRIVVRALVDDQEL